MANGEQGARDRPLLFLSHAGIDTAKAADLAKRIRAANVDVWLDQDDIEPGSSWLDQIEDAIESKSTAFAVLVTEAGARNWVRMEVRQALDRMVAEAREGRRYPFIPIMESRSTSLEQLSPFMRQQQGVFLDDDRAIQKLVGALTATPQELIALVDQPFVGLKAFDPEAAHLFFGRTTETARLVDTLRHRQFVLVVGDSGSGKSSLVRAGLVPEFREGRFADPIGLRPDASHWHVVLMRPTSTPFENLKVGISDATRGVGGLNADLLDKALSRLTRKDPQAIRDALREGAPKDARVLLVVDQFEELWTQLTDDAVRTRFLDGLLDVAREGDDRNRVVGTMRRDYVALRATHAPLTERLEKDADTQWPSLFNLKGMTEDGLRECIEKPLAMAGVPAAKAARLADDVLRDAGNQPGDLALIEMALSQTWALHKEEGIELGAAYRRIGRIEGAIRQAADDVYKGLSDDDKLRAEAIFMRLVTLGNAGGTTRRVARLDEFDEDTASLARRLGDEACKRLVVLAGKEGEETVELSHEQLTSQWPTYVLWLRDAKRDKRATDKRALDRLIDDAQSRESRGVIDIATGSARRDYASLLRRRPHWLSALERRFVRRSTLVARLAVSGVLVVLLALVVGSLMFAADQRDQAEKERRQRDIDQATGISLGLEFPLGAIASRERFSLAQLAHASDEVRLAFVDRVLSDSNFAKRFCRNSWATTRALAGTNPETRALLLAKLDGPFHERDGPTQVAVANLAHALRSPRTFEYVVSALGAADDMEECLVLAASLSSIGAGLPRDEKVRALRAVLAALANAPPVDGRWTARRHLAPIGKVDLAMLASDLDRKQAASLWETAVAATSATTFHDDVQSTLGSCLAAIVSKVQSGDELDKVFDALLAALQEAAGERPVEAIGEALTSIAHRLDAEACLQAFEAVLGVTLPSSSRESPPWPNARLAKCLKALVAGCDEQQLPRVLSVSLSSLGAQSFERQKAMEAVFGELARRLTPAQVTDVLPGVLDWIRRARGYHVGLVLEPFVREVFETIGGDDNPTVIGVLFTGFHGSSFALQDLCERCLAAMVKRSSGEKSLRLLPPILRGLRESDMHRLEPVGRMLHDLADRVGDEHRLAAFRLLVERLRQWRSGERVHVLASVVRSVAKRAGRANAPLVFDLLLESATDCNLSQLGGIGAGLDGLASWTNSANARRAIEIVLARVSASIDASSEERYFPPSTSPVVPGFEDKGLAALAAKVTDPAQAGDYFERARKILDRAKVRANEIAGDSDEEPESRHLRQRYLAHAAEVLGTAMNAFGRRVNPGTAQAQVTTLLHEIRGAERPFALARGDALAGVVRALPSTDADTVAPKLLLAFREADDLDQRAAFARCLSFLVSRLDGSEARQFLRTLTAMGDGRSKYATHFGAAIRALGMLLGPTEAEDALSALLAILRGTYRSGDSEILGRWMAEVAMRLEGDSVRPFVDKLLAQDVDLGFQRDLAELAGVLKVIHPRIESAQAAEVYEMFVRKFSAAVSERARALKLEALRTLAGRLHGGHAEASFVVTVDALAALRGRSEDRDALVPLLHDLSAKLQGAARQRALHSLYIRDEEVGDQLVFWGAVPEGYEAVSTALIAELGDAQLGLAINTMLRVLVKSAEVSVHAVAGRALLAMVSRLQRPSTVSALEQVIESAGEAYADETRLILERAAAKLIERMDEAQARAAISSSVHRARGEPGNDSVRIGPSDPRINGAVISFAAGQLGPERAREVLDAGELSLRGVGEPDRMRALARGHAALARQVAEVDKRRAARSLVSELKVPWAAGEPTRILLEALDSILGTPAGRPRGLWDAVERVESAFNAGSGGEGAGVDLRSPPNAAKP